MLIIGVVYGFFLSVAFIWLLLFLFKSVDDLKKYLKGWHF